MRLVYLLLSAALAGEVLAAESLTLQYVLFDGKTWSVSSNAAHAKFRAVVTELWPPGLVPIFAVERNGAVHLRRFPLKGQENNTEPLFFALPLADEQPFLSGRWQVNATRHTERPFLYWELLMEGSKIAGRLDRNTDYRFGTIASGHFVSNRLELKIEYIADSYTLIGTYSNGRLHGEWTRADEGEAGRWEATQEPVTLPSQTNILGLFEWREGSSRSYLLDGESCGSGWQKEPRALGRVWK